MAIVICVKVQAVHAYFLVVVYAISEVVLQHS